MSSFIGAPWILKRTIDKSPAPPPLGTSPSQNPIKCYTIRSKRVESYQPARRFSSVSASKSVHQSRFGGAVEIAFVFVSLLDSPCAPTIIEAGGGGEEKWQWDYEKFGSTIEENGERITRNLAR